MTEIFSQIPKKPLTRSTISRYNPHVDNYAKAPMRRLFHLVDLSSRTDTAVSRITCNDLHTLIFGQVEQVPRYQQFPHSLKKHRGVTLSFPVRNPPSETTPSPASPSPRSLPRYRAFRLGLGAIDAFVPRALSKPRTLFAIARRPDPHPF